MKEVIEQIDKIQFEIRQLQTIGGIIGLRYDQNIWLAMAELNVLKRRIEQNERQREEIRRGRG